MNNATNRPVKPVAPTKPVRPTAPVRSVKSNQQPMRPVNNRVMRPVNNPMPQQPARVVNKQPRPVAKVMVQPQPIPVAVVKQNPTPVVSKPARPVYVSPEASPEVAAKPVTTEVKAKPAPTKKLKIKKATTPTTPIVVDDKSKYINESLVGNKFKRKSKMLFTALGIVGGVAVLSAVTTVSVISVRNASTDANQNIQIPDNNQNQDNNNDNNKPEPPIANPNQIPQLDESNTGFLQAILADFEATYKNVTSSTSLTQLGLSSVARIVNMTNFRNYIQIMPKDPTNDVTIDVKAVIPDQTTRSVTLDLVFTKAMVQSTKPYQIKLVGFLDDDGAFMRSRNELKKSVITDAGRQISAVDLTIDNYTKYISINQIQNGVTCKPLWVNLTPPLPNQEQDGTTAVIAFDVSIGSLNAKEYVTITGFKDYRTQDNDNLLNYLQGIKPLLKVNPQTMLASSITPDNLNSVLINLPQAQYRPQPNSITVIKSSLKELRANDGLGFLNLIYTARIDHGYGKFTEMDYTYVVSGFQTRV